MDDGEAALLERISRGDLSGAATLLIRRYGPEIYGFLAAQLRDETAAAEAFSSFTEDLWRGLPGFQGRSSLRVWSYTLARNAATRHVVAPHRRRDRNVPLSEAAELVDLAERVRTETLPFLRTEAKAKLAEIRQRLSPDECALLVLRVDRGLDWTDVARILFPEDVALSDGDLRTLVARLRKRFQAVKTKVRRMAKDAGLFEP